MANLLAGLNTNVSNNQTGVYGVDSTQNITFGGFTPFGQNQNVFAPNQNVAGQNQNGVSQPARDNGSNVYNLNSERLVGEDLAEARINKEDFPVTQNQAAKAEDLVFSLKAILSQDGDNITPEQWAKVDMIFNKINKDPRLAEAFVTEANASTFENDKDNTTSLLGIYESALIAKYNNFGNSKTAADATKKVATIKAQIAKNVEQRNPDAWTEFDNKHTGDNEAGNSFSRNRESILSGGIIGTGAVAGTAICIAASNCWNPVGWTVGLGLIGYGIYKACTK